MAREHSAGAPLPQTLTLLVSVDQESVGSRLGWKQAAARTFPLMAEVALKGETGVLPVRPLVAGTTGVKEEDCSFPPLTPSRALQ